MANKKSCYGCRALDYDTKRPGCVLGYPISTRYNITITPPTPVPVDLRCPKPRTYDELFKLLNEKEANDAARRVSLSSEKEWKKAHPNFSSDP